jgi:hypothetical protein
MYGSAIRAVRHHTVACTGHARPTYNNTDGPGRATGVSWNKTATTTTYSVSMYTGDAAARF